MTENEAKEYMENEIRCIQRARYCNRDCANCYLVKEEKPLLESFGIAIKSIEKQIPKKPYYEADGYSDGELVYDYAKCPICGHDFEYGINDWECEYCSDCGQKLDWE